MIDLEEIKTNNTDKEVFTIYHPCFDWIKYRLNFFGRLRAAFKVLRGDAFAVYYDLKVVRILKDLHIYEMCTRDNFFRCNDSLDRYSVKDLISKIVLDVDNDQWLIKIDIITKKGEVLYTLDEDLIKLLYDAAKRIKS